MASTLTPNISLRKPAITDGGWGTELNTNADTTDNQFGASSGHEHTGVAGEGPKLDHGNALTGLGDDDHSVYHKTGETSRAFLETAFLDEANTPTQRRAGYTPVIDMEPAKVQYVYAVFPVPTDMDVALASSLKVSAAMSLAQAGSAFQLDMSRVVISESGDITGTGTLSSFIGTPLATAKTRRTHTPVQFSASTFANNDVVALRIGRNGTINTVAHHGGNLRLITLELEYSTRRGAV